MQQGSLHVSVLQPQLRLIPRGECISLFPWLLLTRDLQYEICENTEVVDLLVSVTYIAARDGTSEGPFPIGLGLRIPPLFQLNVPVDEDGLRDFDELDNEKVGAVHVQVEVIVYIRYSHLEVQDHRCVARRASPRTCTLSCRPVGIAHTDRRSNP